MADLPWDDRSGRLDDRQASWATHRSHGLGAAAAELPGQDVEPLNGLWSDGVPDPGAPTFTGDPARFTQHLEMVRRGGLTDSATAGQIAGAGRPHRGQLAQDREPRRVGDGLEEEEVRVSGFLHAGQYIGFHLY